METVKIGEQTAQGWRDSEESGRAKPKQSREKQGKRTLTGLDSESLVEGDERILDG
jgi:hypothetical protein